MSDDGNDGGYDFVSTGQKSQDIPTDVTRIEVHPSVKRIMNRHFHHCTRLTSVFLGDRLERIGGSIFSRCRSLRKIIIPPAIRLINDLTFYKCSQLTTVIIGQGVKDIGKWAFMECRTLQRTAIPPAVEVINEGAFKKYTVDYCDSWQGGETDSKGCI